MTDKLVLGCGYLGRRVAALWRDAGQRVFATTRSAQRADEFRALGLEPLICDVTRPETLNVFPRSVDVIVSCVGLDRTAGLSMRAVYVDGLANVLDALSGWSGRFIHVSSTGVYAQTNGEEVDEDAATEPSDETGCVILDAERLLRTKQSDAVILRFAGIYGSGRLIRAQALKAGEPLVGDAEKWLNLIHVEDGASVVVAAGERGAAGAIYNVCDDRPIRRRIFYTRLAEVLGAPPARFALPSEAPLPLHERANRRIANGRMKRELEFTLRYPSFEEGLTAS